MFGRCVAMVLVAVVVLAGTFAACGTGDKERIEAQNDAAGATSEADGATPGHNDGGAVTISVFDLRVGDCVADRDETIFDDEGIDQIRVAPCNHKDVTGAVTELFLVEDPPNPESPFPGEDALVDVALERCNGGKPYTYLIPLAESWSGGDRTIVCMDDYTAIYVLGGCVDDLDRAVACEHEDAVRVVTGLVDMSGDFDAEAEYPGVDHFDEVFERQCRSDDDYYLYPTEVSWSAGDREIVCTRPKE